MWKTYLIEGIGSFHLIRPKPDIQHNIHMHTSTSMHEKIAADISKTLRQNERWEISGTEYESKGNSKIAGPDRMTDKYRTSVIRKEESGNGERYWVEKSESEWEGEYNLQWIYKASELTALHQINDSGKLDVVLCEATTATTIAATKTNRIIRLTASRYLSLQPAQEERNRHYRQYRLKIRCIWWMRSKGAHAKVCIFTLNECAVNNSLIRNFWTSP